MAEFNIDLSEKYEPLPGQKKAHSCPSKYVLYGGSVRPQPLYSSVLTPSGHKNMGEIVAGDCVISSTGEEVPVLATQNQGIRDVYEVILSNGRKAQAADKHKWIIKVEGWQEKATTDRLFSVIQDKDVPEEFYPFLPYYEKGICLWSRLKHIRYIGKEEVKCITIDHPSSLYITDDNILTLNSGKSVWLVNEALMLSLETPGNVGVICRNELATFMKTTYLTMDEFIPQELVAEHNRSDNRIELINGSVIYYMGLRSTGSNNPVDRIKSMSLGWFAVDEASEIKEDIFLIFTTRLSLKLPGIRHRGLMASNPEPGWLKYRFVDQDLPDHTFVPARPDENPYIPDDYIENMRRDLPPEWVQRYIEGSWEVTEQENKLFPYWLVHSAMERELIDSQGYPVEMGLDVGRSGRDPTVLCVRRGEHVEFPYARAHQRSDTMIQEIIPFLDEEMERIQARNLRRVERNEEPEPDLMIKVDASGVGGPVADQLRSMGYNAFDFVGGARAEDSDKYFNLRSESYWMLRQRLMDGEIILPNDKLLMRDMTNMTFSPRGDKKIFVETREKLAKQGASPDRADAVMMAFARPSHFPVKMFML